MSDLLRFEIWQVLLLENLCDVCLWKHHCVKIGAGLKNCSSGQVVTEAWTLLWCILGLRFTNDTNFIFPPPPNFQFLYFQIDEQWGLISCTHQSVWRAKNELQLRYTWFPAMSDLLRFEIWQVLLLENLCDVCLRKHGCVKIGAGLKNCSGGQVVTGAWILLSCILRLRYTKDTNFIFSPPNFQFVYFQIYEQWGLISCTHKSVWRAINALQLTYTWFPVMSDLLRFEIWQVLLLENLCDVCLWKHRCVEIGFGLKNCSWGQVVKETWILLWCILCLRFTNDINSIFFRLKFSVFLFSNRRAMGSHILHSSIGLEG